MSQWEITVGCGQAARADKEKSTSWHDDSLHSMWHDD